MTRVAPAGLDARTVLAVLIGASLAVSSAIAQTTTPPFPAAPNAVRVGGSVQIPARTKYVAPDYPDALRQAGVRGTVNVETLISPAGKVQDARVVKSVAQLDRLALDAVRQWEFEPTVVNSSAVPLIITVNVFFPPKPVPSPRGAGDAAQARPGTGDATGSQAAPGGGRYTEDLRAISMMRSQHDAAVRARVVDGVLKFYADDALLMPPGENTVIGASGIRAWLAKGTLPTPGNIALDIEVVGELAFCRLDPSGSTAPAARTAADQFRVMWLLAKQEDGSWKIAASIWNTVGR